MDLAVARRAVAAPTGMDAAAAAALLDLLMSGNLAVNDGAALLRDLAERGETGTELAAFVRGLRARAAVVTGPDHCLDVCGTGGSSRVRFNVSTTVAVILAAAGVPVAKHGNRGSQAPNGSFDLLEALGVPIDLPPSAWERLLRETGLCFLFARRMHPAVGAVVPYRKAAGRRTIFNLAGPLANPVAVSHQVIGTVEERTARVVAAALAELGGSTGLIVWGEPGIDEASISGETRFLTVAGGRHLEGVLPAPADRVAYADIPGGDATVNARLFQAIIAGEERGPLRRMVCLNAGLALDLWHGRPPSADGPGSRRAEELLSAGTVADFFAGFLRQARLLAAT
jgi:anthranilate phosphoribosyltransferase